MIRCVDSPLWEGVLGHDVRRYAGALLHDNYLKHARFAGLYGGSHEKRKKASCNDDVSATSN